MQQVRDDDALMSTIHREFADVMGPLDGGDLSSSRLRAKSRRLSFKHMGSQVAARMAPTV